MARVADWRLPYPDKFITGHSGTLSDFRKKRNMQPHSGTDWARPLGTRIPAIAKGTIRNIQFSKVLGWVVTQTAMDKDGQVWFLSYCHLDEKPGYEIGQKIVKGQTVGLIGNTGMSSGPHLHATASKTLKGVFGATSEKVDLYKLILANTKGAEAKQKDTKAKAVVEAVTMHEHECEHCGKKWK